MKPKPNLIPRFNLDYRFLDFAFSFKSIFTKNNFDLNQLEQVFNNGSFFFTNSGRSSLYVLLKALNLPKGSKIGVPLYSCTVVFDAILKAGHVPCFIDIELNNYTIDPQDLEDKIEDLNAVVVIHTFGRPADMDEIKKVVDNVPIIEDCAHSLLSEYRGKKTGTLGDTSFFSLAKYISIGEGGLIVLKDNELAERVQKEIDLLDDLSVLEEIKHSLIAYTRSFFYHKPWFGLFALLMGLAMEEKVDLMNKRSFRITKIGRGDLGLMLKKISSFGKIVEMQRENSFFLIDGLKDTPLKLPYESKDTYCNYYLFPIRFKKEKRDLVSDFLRDKGIDTSKLYNETPLKAKQHYGYTGDCPNTEKLADTILTIPNYYTLKENELLKIVESIKEVFK